MNTFKTYLERSGSAKNPQAKRLYQLMAEKQTNLALAVDEPEADLVLKLADQIGPELCILKTHIDIIEGFNEGFIAELSNLAKKHNFLIFEDRKFADIGNTV